MTPAECFARLNRAGLRLAAQPGGELSINGAAPLPDELLASLRHHKAELWNYVSALPGGCWPGWKGVLMG
jgi:hypothetical protein